MSWWWWCRFARRQDLAGFGAGWDSLAEALPHWGVSLVVTGDLFSIVFVEMVNSARDPLERNGSTTVRYAGVGRQITN